MTAMMKLFARRSLQTRVLVALAFLLMVSFLLIAALSIRLAGQQLNRNLVEQSGQQAYIFGHAISEAVILGDIPAIEQLMKSRVAQQDVDWLRFNGQMMKSIYVENQTIHSRLPEWFRLLLNAHPSVNVYSIEVGGRNYGLLSLQINPYQDEERIWTLFGRAFASFAVLLVLTVWLIQRLLRFNLKDLDIMREMANQLESGNLKARIPISPSSPPEIVETAIAFNHSATRIEELLDEMRQMAYHDPLTGLPNRRAIEGRINRALQSAQNQNARHAFCYIDLDQFKLINDICGHAAGDLLLSQLPPLLKTVLPKDAYIGRLGGDEFGLLLFDKSLQDAYDISCDLITAVFGFDFMYEDRTYHIGASVGISAITSKSRSIGEILSQADVACYEAKQAGRGRCYLYETSLTSGQSLQEEMDWVAWFGQAIAEKRLLLYRQRIEPLNGIDSSAHYEILLRIRRYTELLEPPGKFLAAAERFNLSPTVDRWVLRTLADWLARHPQDLSVHSVNLSGISLNDDYFLDFVLDTLDAHNIPGHRLAFEITETAAVRNLAKARTFMETLKSRGCKFYLDDFGKGMASFSYLKQLPADFLKIDGAFVLEMLRDSTDYAIVNAFNQIAHDLSRKSVAECVENQYLLDKLYELGVDYVQGHAIHVPEPLPE